MRAFVTKLVAAVVFSIGLIAVAGQAAAGCNSGCAPPPPPTPPHNPPPPNNCHSCGGNTNVNVNVTVKANASAAAFGAAGANATVYGGGYGNWSQTPGYPQPVGGLAVVTGDAGMYESYSESRSFTRRTVIQASCIDDTGVPHPASQVSSDREIDNRYLGELYRCIAGTHMQITMADFGDCLDNGAVKSSYEDSMSESSASSRASGSYGRGGHSESREDSSMSSNSSSSMSSQRSAACSADYSHINFDGGKTMSCQKGEALWFDHGNLTCKVQIPARQCNERSLLRRFGVGIKVLTVTRSESIMKRREVSSASKSSYTSSMTFDGGVGGFVQ